MLDMIVQRVVETEHPERIILFGSRAREAARPGSDYDLLVVKESNQPRYRRSVELYAKLADLPAEVDILVYTPEEIFEWSAVPQAFVTTAVREGKVLYERQS
jgi:predicted nucleotidyltransferase